MAVVVVVVRSARLPASWWACLFPSQWRTGVVVFGKALGGCLGYNNIGIGPVRWSSPIPSWLLSKSYNNEGHCSGITHTRAVEYLDLASIYRGKKKLSTRGGSGTKACHWISAVVLKVVSRKALKGKVYRFNIWDSTCNVTTFRHLHWRVVRQTSGYRYPI
eukprot:scaffold157361_cov44-Cyclotella_meneghiniana.AAC.1